MELGSSAGSGRLVLVGDAVEWFRQPVRVDGWRAAARSGRRIVTQHRVVTRIGCTPNFGCLRGSLTFIRGKASLLRGRFWNQEKRTCEYKQERNPLSKLILLHGLSLSLSRSASGE